MIEEKRKNQIHAQAALCWRFVLLLLLLISSARQTLAFFPELDRLQQTLALLHMLAGFLLATFLREYRRRRGKRGTALLLLLSIVLLFLLSGPRQILMESSHFFAQLLKLWNRRFDFGLRLPADSGVETTFAFARLLFYLVGCWITVFHSRCPLLKLFSCLISLLLPLLSDCSVPLAAVLLVIAFLGEWMTAGERFGRRRILWTAGSLLFLLLCIGTDQRKEIPAVTVFRNRSEKTLRELCYGKDSLPEGDLRQAAQLQRAEETMLTVHSEQAKNLYLRGFVGGRYTDGCWMPLRRSDFSTAGRSGILQWLQTRGFSALKAPAEYWSLCDEGEVPPENSLEIRVQQASRAYLYLPATVSLLNEQNLQQVLDYRFSAQNLLGERNYALRERSVGRPAELLTAEDWLTAPDTEDRQQYCAAEAEYRTLVHELYTETDADLTPLLRQLFWEDYDTENAGIYRAVSRVRQVLRENIQYTEEPTAAPAGEDPIRWMLRTKQEGNSVLFAAAAAEALRLQGIPTRYVEGYYASEAAFRESRDGSVTLSGKDAHAWVEIYFDGMGWLPVDVTPGYYYDAVVLQQMVNTPDLVHKTAKETDAEALDVLQNTEDAASPPSAGTEEVVDGIRVWRQCLLGALVLLLFLLILFHAVLFFFLGFRWCLQKKRYVGMTAEEKLVFLRKCIFRQLEMLGMPVVLGMAAEETDRQLCRRFSDFAPGEYLRVSEILEKAVYGGEVPAAYELRTLKCFSVRLAQHSFFAKGFGMRNITSGNLTVRGIFDIMKTLT